ncbi:MAG: HIT domain-containing protein [Candidatus Liptonbacteria bacterium]|nr:HIT domain-containing protein [Candidatus Liptonbacteria bacterium]
MSELRRDSVSRDWIIMAPDRAGRPHAAHAKKHVRRASPKRTCPFENLKASGNSAPIVSYPNDARWEVAVIPNKYPALVHHQACLTLRREGPYERAPGIGHHDLVVTRDHDKNFGALSRARALRVLLVLQERYRTLAKDRCLVYTSTFFNWGASAGASIYHPHYQVLTLPIIPPHIQHSLIGSKDYKRRYGRCVHCDMVKFEAKREKRIIYKDARAVAFAPFVSQQEFEFRIFPRRHLPFFEYTPVADLLAAARALQHTIRRMKTRLNDPDFNFFIHTAPLKEQRKHDHYHWHIEVLPKTSIAAGFELSTGVEINVVDPDTAAALLR